MQQQVVQLARTIAPRPFGHVAWVTLLLATPAFGHDGPQHVIDALTLQMATKGATAERLYQRAIEYRTLGQLDRAARDLRQAIKRDSQHRAAQVELAQVLLAAGESKEALAVVDQALTQLRSVETAPLRMARCDALLALGQPQRALAECRQSCQENPHEIEWLLKRSQLDAQLGLHAERVAELTSAQREQPAGVLQIEWVEALLDAGRAADALPTIEAELADSRLQSSWLIRRARARQLLDKPSESATDLHAAIAEINQRIHPERPDLSLIADRGLAYALLGERDAAKRDLQFAKTRHADPWMVWRLERALVQSVPAPKTSSRQ